MCSEDGHKMRAVIVIELLRVWASLGMPICRLHIVCESALQRDPVLCAISFIFSPAMLQV